MSYFVYSLIFNIEHFNNIFVPGCSVRWFRLRGNLLFYLKGPEPWYEPVGVIILGHHQVKIQPQDENGQWPFHIGMKFLNIFL